jgi:hypothetical protein
LRVLGDLLWSESIHEVTNGSSGTC